MIFQGHTLTAIAEGRVTLAFRRWRQVRVRAGGTLRTAVGIVGVTSVEPIDTAAISNEEARQAGCASRSARVDELAKYQDGQLTKNEERRTKN